jgi:hypothetical protein
MVASQKFIGFKSRRPVITEGATDIEDGDKVKLYAGC